MRSQVICYEKRECFGQESVLGGNVKMCRVLNGSYRFEPCPFCKPVAKITNGVEYPFDPHYEPHKKEES